jgi:acyl dehydratase
MDAAALLSHRFPEVTHTYDDGFTMLYGLSIGVGSDPLDERQLRYVYEDRLVAFPTLPVVLATPGMWIQEPQFEIDWRRVLHGEQEIVINDILAPTGRVSSQFRITAIDDKGAAKGAVIHSERTLSEAGTDRLLATLRQTTFARGDGGCGSAGSPLRSGWVKPERPPDHLCELPTASTGALLYRLTGDRNPIHGDPTIARTAGFEQPILHGLCTYGMAAHALVRTLADYDASMLRQISGRFASPVLPGETLTVRIWGDGGAISFDVLAGERTVFTHGRAQLTS